MEEGSRTYICIDLRSYYASVECVARGLDPLAARLVVADASRGRGTICLAVSPALKALGVPNRCRVFQIPQGLDYIMATPRMRRYMEVSAEIFGIYLQYVSSEDVHIYSVDECFIDITPYLSYYRMGAQAFARMLMDDVLAQTGIPSTCGIGPNLFLAKVALDIEAKHAPGGIAVMDQMGFRQRIWPHRPLTDIWGIGRGIQRRLESMGLHTLYDVAHASTQALKRQFGINGQLLYEHAWGHEPCTIAEIHAYKPRSSSISVGQVLMRDYSMQEARVIFGEMAREAVLQLGERHCACGSIAANVCYSFGLLYTNPCGRDAAAGSPGAWANDAGAAQVAAKRPSLSASASAHAQEKGAERNARDGSVRRLSGFTSSPKVLMPKLMALFDEVADPALPIRRLSVGLGDLLPQEMETLSLFSDSQAMEGERHLVEAILQARSRFGRDAVMWGSSLLDCATGFERARQIGGHRE